MGAIDFLGEIPGGGGFANLVGKSSTIEAMGTTFLCINLDALIETKKASGCPKDLEAIAELQEIQRLKREA